MVIWGASPIATRLATEDLDPLVVAVLRTVLAGLVAVPLVATRGIRPPTSPRSRLLLGVSAASGFVIFPLVYTLGQDRTSAMHGVAILAGLPVFTGMWAALVMRRLPGAWWLAGCAIALVGEAVIIAVRGDGGDDMATLAGDLTRMSLPQVVQLLHHTHQTGRLEVVAGGVRAPVHLLAGHVSDVTLAGESLGDARTAFLELCGLLQGRFAFHADSRAAARTARITGNTAGLLLEALRLRDEETEAHPAHRAARVA